MSVLESWICDLSETGYLEIVGLDAECFLQGQLTCDLAEVTIHQSRLALYCNQKGRVLTAGRLYRIQDRFFFQLPKSMLELTAKTLQKYAVFSKVSIETAENFTTLAFANLSWHDLDSIESLPGTVNEVVVGESSFITALHIEVNEAVYLWFGERKTRDMFLEQYHSFTPKAQAHWDHWEITRGIPRILPKTSDQFSPHQLDYHRLDAISWTKGCYLGQEIIARIHHRGAVKQHLYRIALPEGLCPQPGDRLIEKDDRPIGMIVNVLDQEALAVISENIAGPIYYLSRENPILSTQRVYE